MPRITRRAAATLCADGLATCRAGLAAAATACSNEALAALNVPNFTVASATRSRPTAHDAAHCDVQGAVATDGEAPGRTPRACR